MTATQATLRTSGARPRLAGIVAAITALLFVTSAAMTQAVIVSNGGFESPDVGGPIFLTPTGWTNVVGSASTNDGVLMTDGGGFVGPVPPEGTQAVVLQTVTGSPTSPAGVFQGVPLSALTIYKLDFFVAHSVLTPTPAALFEITLDGTPISSGSLVAAGVYTPVSTTFSNTVAGTHTLSLNNVTLGSDMWVAFDGVAITDIGIFTLPVPEPTTVALLGVGLLCVLRKTRRG